MDVLTDLASHLQVLFTTEADERAAATGFVQRHRQLTGPAFLQIVVFGWLEHPAASIPELAAFADDLGVHVTAQALDKRFTLPAVQFLADSLTAGLQQLFVAVPQACPLLQRFQGVYVLDSTTITLPATCADCWPGCGGSTPEAGAAALKCHTLLELTTGAWQLTVSPGRCADVTDPLAEIPLPVGALRLCDRGYFDLEQLDAYAQAGVFWLSRLPAGVKVRVPGGRWQTLASFLTTAGPESLDLTVEVGKSHPLTCRLLARRLPEALAAKRRQQLQKKARRKGRAVSKEQWTLCGWQVVITNLSAEQLTWAEAWVLVRARWQVELLFKLWKRHGGVDKLGGVRPARALGEWCAKLLGQLVQNWVLLASVGSPLAASHVKAAKVLRRKVGALAKAVGERDALVRVLRDLCVCLPHRSQRQRRGRQPTTPELLADPQRLWVEEAERVRAAQAEACGEEVAWPASPSTAGAATAQETAASEQPWANAA